MINTLIDDLKDIVTGFRFSLVVLNSPGVCTSFTTIAFSIFILNPWDTPK